MGRRTILLITALVVAALGTALVFLYVRSADDRALAGQEQVQVLFATQQIPVGQSAETASTNGSLELRTVAANSVAEGALSDIDPIANEVALTTIFPGQQIVSAAFGDVTGVSAIPIPDDKMALSLQLGDPERVAGFLGAGSEVAVFVTLRNPNETAAQNEATAEQTSLLIPRVQVITVGNVQPVPADDHDQRRRAEHRGDPPGHRDPGGRPGAGAAADLRLPEGRAVPDPADRELQGRNAAARPTARTSSDRGTRSLRN